MIIWITGNSGSGKTTLARQMKTDRTIILDGDEIREVFQNKDLSFGGRWEHNLRTARLAKLLESQGFGVIVSLICPYKKLRNEVKKITNCSFIYLSGGKKGGDYPYEMEDDKFYFSK
uniref:Putative adenylyl-sulfate kinase n=1 Tax=viral metagenome TaxID=1070528 RepID=A0A6H1ZG27_9ZZZZ